MKHDDRPRPALPGLKLPLDDCDLIARLLLRVIEQEKELDQLRAKLMVEPDAVPSPSG